MVQLVIPRVPSDVLEHLQREREVEAFFIGQSKATVPPSQAEKERPTGEDNEV